MTKITINKANIVYKNIPDIKNISFDVFNSKVYSAIKVEKMVGVFVSQPITGDSSWIAWKNLVYDVSKPYGVDVYVYLKSSETLSGLNNNYSWNGPYLNGNNDMSDISGKCFQFIVVLLNDGNAKNINYEHITVANTPIFRSISLEYYSSESAVKFYTKTFSLGFNPKHILLTYNGSVPDNSIVRFAVTGEDTIDIGEYQYIEPNKIEELSGLSVLSENFKLMIEMLGSKEDPVIVHEFAFMVSGDETTKINKYEYEFSSSCSSFSSSSSSSS